MEQEQLAYNSLGEAIEECISGSVHAWRTQHAAAVAIDDLLAYQLRHIETTTMHKRAGRVDVYVTLAAANEHRSDMYYFRLQRMSGGRYVRVGGTLH